MRISDWSSDVCSSDLSRTDHYPVGADAAHRSGDRRRDQIAPARTPSAPAGHALEAADADLGRHTRNRLSLEQPVKARRSPRAFLVDHRRGREIGKALGGERVGPYG